MGIGKKVRFEVLKRDGFTCKYCGRKPPDVTLEVDHVIAKAQGGTDVFENLITACFDCNRGKSKNGLKGSIFHVRDPKAERKAAKAVKQLQRLDAEREKAIADNTDHICQLFTLRLGIPADELSPAAYRWAAKALTRDTLFLVTDITEAWAARQDEWPDHENQIRYFMGVCKHKIKDTYGRQNG